MHTSRTALLITSGIAMISTLFTWRYYDQVGEAADESGMSGMMNAAGISSELVAENGLEIKWGFATLALFAFVMLIAVLGKRSTALATGSTKFSLLVINATTVVYHIILISIFLIAEYHKPAFGLYIAFICSLAALVIPYLFNKKGDFDPMTPKEIADDIEDSAEDFEDKAEEIGDKIEDKFEKKPKEIKDKIKKDMSKIEQSIEKKSDEVSGKIDKKGKEIKDKINEDMSKVEQSIEKKSDEVSGKIDKKGKEIKDKIKGDMSKVEDSIEKKSDEVSGKIDEKGKEITGQLNEKVEDTLGNQDTDSETDEDTANNDEEPPVS